ncbi:cobalamin biosynthesis protein CbiX [Paracoccus kondratievae]
MRKALIVAHGQPGDPVPQQNAVEALAARVAALLPQAQVRGATLAMLGALDIADDKTLIYPLFMATGWFTRSELPRRLTLSGAARARVLPPFGSDPGLPGLCLALISEAAAGQRWSMAQTHLLIAAHGSGRSRAPAEAAQQMAKTLAPILPLSRAVLSKRSRALPMPRAVCRRSRSACRFLPPGPITSLTTCPRRWPGPGFAA